MGKRIKFFVGLDAHKDSIAVAACEAGRETASRWPSTNWLRKPPSNGCRG